MAEPLSSELKNWFLSLGFDNRNLSSDEIEDEFKRLSPPEMRDIWRNILNHVLPVDKCRYIKKVLLLYELKKLNKNNHEKHLIKKNINSVKKLQLFKNQEKIAEQVNNCLRAVEEANVKINDKNQQICDWDNKLKHLLAENSKRTSRQAMIELKIQNHEKRRKELLEMHSYLSNLNSSRSTKKVKDEHSLPDIMKDILKKISDFGRHKNCEDEMKIIDEQQVLMNEIVKLTFDAPVSTLHKTVIYMLRDTLSALLKLSDHVSSKNDKERSRHFNSKLIQLEKQSVELFVENHNLKKKVEKLREDVQNRRLQLLTIINNKCDESAQKNFEMWLDSESLKHCMNTRLSYLIKKEESMKRNLSMSTVADVTNASDHKKLFRVINDYTNQLVSMEQELSTNLMYLSDEPINSFIECQNHCKGRIEQFVQTKESLKYEDMVVKLTDSFKIEMSLLKQFNLFSDSNRFSDVIPDSHHEAIPDFVISEFIKKSSFYVYLSQAYNDINVKVDQETSNAESFKKKCIEIKNEEENFANHLRKLVAETKNNLKNIEEHSNSCLKNFELWTKSSVNEIIPQQMLVADRSFTEWHKRYVAVIQYLRKQQTELSKLQ